MDTFYAHGEFCWSKTKCLNALPRRTICVTRRDMEISCSPAITVSLSCVFTWCVFSLLSMSFWVYVFVCVLCNQGLKGYWNCVWSYFSAVTAKPASGTRGACLWQGTLTFFFNFLHILVFYSVLKMHSVRISHLLNSYSKQIGGSISHE